MKENGNFSNYNKNQTTKTKENAGLENFYDQSAFKMYLLNYFISNYIL
jgi:hypothetical protein